MKIRPFGLLILLSASIAITLTANTLSAQTAAVEARVTSTTGKSTISGNSGSSVRLISGAALMPGDEIDTTGGGRVVIDMTDGSQVVILPGSHIVFGDYRNAASLRELLQITLGRIRVKINHFQGKPNPYRIKSPTASIAVRGTEFLVMVASLGETRVIVLEGMVEVASLSIPARKLVAEPRRGVVVRSDSTIDFFAPGVLTREVGERDRKVQSNANDQKIDDIKAKSESATNVYERTIENIIENGETALPSRFTAFPDPYIDSLDNPAYAGAFTKAEGRLNIVPSINGSSSAREELRDRFGLSGPRPVDYAFVPEAALFFPFARFRAVVGGSAGYVRNGLQSLTVEDNFPLTAPPFPAGSDGLRTLRGATSGNLFSGSLIVAKSFGSRDQTSVGFSAERLFSRGSLNETTTQTGAAAVSFTKQIASRSSVDRTRLTFGVRHDFGTVRFGAFYRYGNSSGTDVQRFRLIDGAPQPNDLIRTKGNSSEAGFRLRGAISRRLFYGVEGTLLFADTHKNIHRSIVVDSTESGRSRRATLGFGLGYVLNRHTIFSFDAAGGLIATNQRRTEDLTGNPLELERQRSRFLSLHVAVQTDVWKNLFVSASILSLTQSRSSILTFLPDRFGHLLDADGVIMPSGRTHNFYTDFYSNFGTGWQFKPNFVGEYIVTTDYGQTSLRHTFLFRYTFDFTNK